MNPSLSLIGGIQALGQDLLGRLTTPRGGLFYDADYGYDVRQLLNETIGAQSIAKAQSNIQAEVLKDERILRCAATLDFQSQTGDITLTLNCATASGPFRLVVSVTKLTVSMLEPVVNA